MIPGDEWKQESEVAATATPADIRKFYILSQRVLIEFPFSYAGPSEVLIADIANDGELFKAVETTRYASARWHKTNEAKILAILPDYQERPETGINVTHFTSVPIPEAPRKSWLRCLFSRKAPSCGGRKRKGLTDH